MAKTEDQMNQMMNLNLTDQELTEIQKLVERAQAADQAAVAELRDLLDRRPEIWRRLGDLAQHAEMTMLALVAGTNVLAQESITLKLADLKSDLAGFSPSPLEILLVDRIAISWMQVHHADMDAASILSKDKGTTPLSLYAQRRLDSAHRRYLQSIKTLATVRKLIKPPSSPPAIAEVFKQKSKPTSRSRSRQRLPAARDHV